MKKGDFIIAICIRDQAIYMGKATSDIYKSEYGMEVIEFNETSLGACRVNFKTYNVCTIDDFFKRIERG